MNDDVRDELSRFNDGFSPNLGFRPGPEILPDGLVDLQILEAVFDRTFETKELILRLSLRALSGPLAETDFDQTYFMTRSESVARLGGDLKILGFDTDKWKMPQRPFSVEIEKALPKLGGIRFRVKKETNWSETNKKFYHNLRINRRLDKDTPLLPVGVVASPPAPAAQRQQQTPASAGVNGGGQTPRLPAPPDEDSEIPF